MTRLAMHDRLGFVRTQLGRVVAPRFRGRRRRLRHVARDACAIAGVVALLLTLAGIIPFHGERIGWGYARDLYAYWSADPAQPYSTAVGVGFAYLYSPAFLQAMAPLKLLPFELVSILWLLAGLAALWRLGALWMLVIPGVSSDLLLGNVNVFIALAIVLSVQRPGAWAFPLLTKITPGIGMAWLIAQRRWREFAVGLAWVLGIVLISAALQPELWGQWIDVLSASGDTRLQTTAEFGPLFVRLPVALGLVMAAGFLRRPWLLPIAAIVSMPVIWPASLAVLTAIPRLTGADTSADDDVEGSSQESQYRGPG